MMYSVPDLIKERLLFAQYKKIAYNQIFTSKYLLKIINKVVSRQIQE